MAEATIDVLDVVLTPRDLTVRIAQEFAGPTAIGAVAIIGGAASSGWDDVAWELFQTEDAAAVEHVSVWSAGTAVTAELVRGANGATSHRLTVTRMAAVETVLAPAHCGVQMQLWRTSGEIDGDTERTTHEFSCTVCKGPRTSVTVTAHAPAREVFRLGTA